MNKTKRWVSMIGLGFCAALLAGPPGCRSPGHLPGPPGLKLSGAPASNRPSPPPRYVFAWSGDLGRSGDAHQGNVMIHRSTGSTAIGGKARVSSSPSHARGLPVAEGGQRHRGQLIGEETGIVRDPLQLIRRQIFDKQVGGGPGQAGCIVRMIDRDRNSLRRHTRDSFQSLAQLVGQGTRQDTIVRRDQYRRFRSRTQGQRPGVDR